MSTATEQRLKACIATFLISSKDIRARLQAERDHDADLGEGHTWSISKVTYTGLREEDTGTDLELHPLAPSSARLAYDPSSARSLTFKNQQTDLHHTIDERGREIGRQLSRSEWLRLYLSRPSLRPPFTTFIEDSEGFLVPEPPQVFDHLLVMVHRGLPGLIFQVPEHLDSMELVLENPTTWIPLWTVEHGALPTCDSPTSSHAPKLTTLASGTMTTSTA